MPLAGGHACRRIDRAVTLGWIGLDQPDRWRGALEGMSYAPAHCQEYCRAVAASSGLETRLLAGEVAGAKIACPLSIRALDPEAPELVSPYGFGGFATTLASSEFTEPCKTFLRSQGFVTGYIQQHPTLGPKPDADDAHAGGTVFVLDLSLDLPALQARMDQSHRYELRQSLSDGTVLEADKNVLKRVLRDLYGPMIRDKNAAKVYHFSDETLDALSDMEGSLLVGVRREGKVVSAALFLSTPCAAEYFLQASAPEGRPYARRLIWAAVEHFKQAGIPILNLGGGIRAGDGLESFKRRFGGTEIRTMVRKQIYDRAKFDALSQRLQVPATTDGYFPAYWKGAG